MASPATAIIQTPYRKARGRIRVLIADDTPLGCELLKKSLGTHPSIRVVGMLFSAQELVASVSQTAAELVLINADLHEGSLSGIQAASELHTCKPDLPIVVICDRASDELVLSSFRAGASGFLSRSDSLSKLCKCIQAVHKGQVWATSSQLQVLLRALVHAPPVRILDAQGLNLLAQRERQVVGLVGESLTNRDIAARMGINEHTVSNYLFRIYNKLGVSNRVELVLYAIRQREVSQFAG